MAELDEKHVAIARVYAQSMLDLAAGEDEARSLLEELTGLRQVLADQPAFREFFTSPLVDLDERRQTLERVLRGRASDRLVDALLVMDRHGRLDVFDTVVTVYRQLFQERYGEIDVRVVSAVALDDASRARLRETIAQVAGREPILTETVDRNLLGGMVVRFGDRKIDTSVSKDLRTVRAQLAARAEREIHGGRLATELAAD